MGMNHREMGDHAWAESRIRRDGKSQYISKGPWERAYEYSVDILKSILAEDFV
jgi:hypothetical protein